MALFFSSTFLVRMKTILLTWYLQLIPTEVELKDTEE